jgi:hypothetical protein
MELGAMLQSSTRVTLIFVLKLFSEILVSSTSRLKVQSKTKTRPLYLISATGFADLLVLVRRYADPLLAPAHGLPVALQ